MKKKLIFLIVLTFLFTTVMGVTVANPTELNAAPFFQTAKFVNGVVSVSSLNIRQGPDTKFPVVCVLKKGQKVKVFGMLGDWYAVYDTTGGRVGSAFGKYINVEDLITEPVKAPAKAPEKKKDKAPVKSPTPVPSATPKAVEPKGKVDVPKSKAAAAQDLTAAPEGISEDEQSMLDLINKARAEAGAGPLSFDMTVEKISRLKAKDMVENSYFSHKSPTYGLPFDMMKQYGVTFKAAGENIAGNSSVNGAFNAWMNSKDHKKNILNPNFNYTGIGIFESPTYGKVFVQQFIGK